MSNQRRGNSEVEVRSVWSSNLDREFHRIREAVEGKFKYVTVDTEFKVLYKPQKPPLFSSPEERYQTIKRNADEVSVRQLGLTLSADDGSVLVWEFNFAPFHFPEDMEEEDLIAWDLKDLINTYFFTDLLQTSGLVSNPKITWIMFHSSTDVAYLIKLLTFWSPLPDSFDGFMSVVTSLLGECIYDVKYMTKFTNNLYGGLEGVAATLGVERRVGHAHQAGSDSLLTWEVFNKMKNIYFPKDGGRRHAGVLYGLHHI